MGHVFFTRLFRPRKNDESIEQILLNEVEVKLFHEIYKVVADKYGLYFLTCTNLDTLHN